MIKPRLRATPITMPITAPLLRPPPLTALWPRVGSAVADGVTMMVFTWPVTVMTLVYASVATAVEGIFAPGVVLGEGGDVVVKNVLDRTCACFGVS